MADTSPSLLQETTTPQTQNIPLSASQLVDSLLFDAHQRGVSDIHIHPERDCVRVRMRIDGLLEESVVLPAHLHPAILARIKILAGLRTDEHFASQDGRFRFRPIENEAIDIRISIAPTYHGENAVLRLLSRKEKEQTLRGLGCRNSHQLMLSRALEREHGMILATGPTGSGKTTLLYTLLQMLDSETRSIVTLEDPIEYSLAGINQIPVNADRGLTFATSLRSVLRQDPDVIMVGEIRDNETAALATNAALTGHLVLSTLHTNDAPSALPRLLDLGMEPYLISSTVELIVAQRLVRRICLNCRIAHSAREQLLERIRARTDETISGKDIFFKGAGCEQCRGSGYRGRIGVFEILMIDDVIRTAITQYKDIGDLRTLACGRGMLFMADDGLRKARKGITTIEELAHISYV